MLQPGTELYVDRLDVSEPYAQQVSWSFSGCSKNHLLLQMRWSEHGLTWNRCTSSRDGGSACSTTNRWERMTAASKASATSSARPSTADSSNRLRSLRATFPNSSTKKWTKCEARVRRTLSSVILYSHMSRSACRLGREQPLLRFTSFSITTRSFQPFAVIDARLGLDGADRSAVVDHLSSFMGPMDFQRKAPARQ